MNDSSESKKPPDTSPDESNYFKRNDDDVNDETKTDQANNDSNKLDYVTNNELKADQINVNNNINYDCTYNIGGIDIIKFDNNKTDESNVNYQIKDNINSNDNNENLDQINESSNNNDNDANNNEKSDQLNNSNQSNANNNENSDQLTNSNQNDANNSENSDQLNNNSNNNDKDMNNNENFDQLNNNNNLDSASENKKNDQTSSTVNNTFIFDKDANYELVKLSDVTKENIIGQGNFGEDYKVKVNDKINYYLVAKVFYMDYPDYSRESRKRISEHMSIIKQLKFPSILRFHDYSTTGFGNEHRQTVLNSLCDKDSLEKNLNNDEFTFTKKMINIFGIASAMNYLHKHNILHYDLKTSTILEDEFFYPKLTDIGYSKCFQGLKSMAKIKEFSHYIAPEVLIKDEFTQKSEVYSFGLIIFEIMTKANPYQGLSQFNLLTEICEKDLVIPDYIPSAIRVLIQDCMKKDPEERPTFEKICNDLRTNREFKDAAVDNPNEYMQYIIFINNFISDNNSLEQKIEKEIIEIPEDEKKPKSFRKTRKGKSKKTKK